MAKRRGFDEGTRLGLVQANAIFLPGFMLFALLIGLPIFTVITSVGTYLSWRMWSRDYGYHWSADLAIRHYHHEEHAC